VRLVTVKAPVGATCAVAGFGVDRRDHAVSGDSSCDTKDAVVSLFHVLARDDGDDLGRVCAAGGQLVVLECLEGSQAVTHEVVDEGLLCHRVVPVARRLAGGGVVVVT